MRIARSVGLMGILAAVELLAVACHSDSGCIVIGVGSCEPLGNGPASFVVGFPAAKVDLGSSGSGYRGVLHVGDTVVFRLVRDAHGEVITARDTIRAVAWALTDSTAARIIGAADGSGLLVTIAPGVVGAVRANGLQSDAYACEPLNGASTCLRVSVIDVVR